MPWRLPPLNALRVFEAAARCRNFSHAAEELHVTPGAVSRQIRHLEEYMGVQLFERVARTVRVTVAGRALYESLHGAFQIMADATRQLDRPVSTRSLHVWSSVSFAQRWLIPRMSQFLVDRDDVDLTLTTTLKPVDFAETEADVAIRQGQEISRDYVSHLVLQSELAPVCSPGFMAKYGLTDLSQLKAVPLLHTTARPHDWENWLSTVHTKGVPASSGRTFALSSLAYEAAIAGMGIVVAQLSLVEKELASGALVMPFDHVFRDRSADYYLIYPERESNSEVVLEFVAWMLKQSGAPREG